mmetsp:Transcript_7991/g.13409  ORF Transcript_7991/g.13409 Transcript_7991/m.13409 type:complete len:294 (-) Transcript_7991:23-904(-)
MIQQMFLEVLKRFEGGKALKIIDPIEDMEIEYDPQTDDMDIQELVTAKAQIDDELANPRLAQISPAAMEQFSQKEDIKREVLQIEQSIKEASQMIMSKDLVNMKRVLRRLDMIDKHDVPLLKGKVAASLSAADELLATELIFNGFLQNLTSEQIAAVLSCLIYTDGKNEGEVPKEDIIGEPFKTFQKVAGDVADVMIESNIELKKEDYLLKFSPDMMEITMAWCNGSSFQEVCEISDIIYEGTIIRALRRLDELISQMIEASKIIGNNELRDLFQESQKNLKRGIVFTASLYL